MAVRYRKAEAAAVRVGLTHVDRLAGFVRDNEMMQDDAAPDRVTVLLHVLDRDLDLASDLKGRAHKVAAAQAAARRRRQHELRAFNG
jgi:hypothetical protein